MVLSGENCGWCRVLEKRTLTDHRIAELSRKLVCVKLNIGECGALADLYEVKTIPRSLVLNSDGSKISELVGFHSPAEYLPWLENALELSLADAKARREAPRTPSPVGASAEDAKFTVWLLDILRSRTHYYCAEDFRAKREQKETNATVYGTSFSHRLCQ